MRAREFILLEINDRMRQQLIAQFKSEQSTLTDEMINSYIDRFERYRQNLEIKDLSQFLPTKNNPTPTYNWSKLEQMVDAYEAQRMSRAKSKEVDQDSNNNLDLVYDKNNLTILLGDTQEKCIRYGDGYSWCISRKVGNLFSSHRFSEWEPTFYFVYDRDKSKEDPYHHIVIHKIIDNRYILTDADNKIEKEVTWEEIIRIQPKLQGLDSIFKHKPLTDEERALNNKFKDAELGKDEFLALPFKEKEFYVTIRRPLDEETLLSLFGTRSNKNILNRYVISHWKIPLSVYKKLTPGQQNKVDSNQMDKLREYYGAIEAIEYLLNEGYKLDDKTIMDVLKSKGEAIQYLLNAGHKLTKPMIMAALESKGEAIKFLIKAEYPITKPMIMAAIKSKGEAIEYLIDAGYKLGEEITEPMIIDALESNYVILRYLLDAYKLGEEITEPMIIATLKRNGVAFEYLLQKRYKLGEEITEPMIVTALESNFSRRVLEYLINKEYKLTKPMIIAALKRDGWAIESLEEAGYKLGEEITEPMIMTALTSNGSAIKYLINKEYPITKPMIITALEKDGSAIKSLEKAGYEITDEMRVAALKGAPRILKARVKQ